MEESQAQQNSGQSVPQNDLESVTLTMNCLTGLISLADCRCSKCKAQTVRERAWIERGEGIGFRVPGTKNQN